MKKYSNKEMEEITGVKRLRLNHWAMIGFIKIIGTTGLGSGNCSSYEPEDLYNIFLFKTLLDSGLHGKVAAKIMREIEFKETSQSWFLSQPGQYAYRLNDFVIIEIDIMQLVDVVQAKISDRE